MSNNQPVDIYGKPYNRNDWFLASQRDHDPNNSMADQ